MTRRQPFDMCSSEEVASWLSAAIRLEGRPHNRHSSLKSTSFGRFCERLTAPPLAYQIFRQQGNADDHDITGGIR